MSSAALLLLSAVSLSGTPDGVLLDFSTEWCKPCQRMSPIVDRLARQGYAVRKVDCDERPDLVSKYDINLMPTFVLIVRGKEVRRIVGETTESELRRMATQIPVVDDGAKTGVSAPSSASARAPAAAVANVEKPSGFRLPFFGRSRKKDKPTETDVEPTVRGKFGAENEIGRGASFDSLTVCPRIRIRDAQGVSFGSGTVIESRVGHTVILTCGHIFRDLTDSSTIEVDVFAGDRYETYVGKVLKFDLKSDVGLLSIPTASVLPTASVATTSNRAQRSDLVYSIGCSAGERPTKLQHHVTALNRYLGPDNIECTGQPVQGRSGGGLFNTRGELVGVCVAADPADKRGFYAGLLAVQDLLEASGLKRLYQTSDSSNQAALAARGESKRSSSTVEAAVNSAETVLEEDYQSPLIADTAPARDVRQQLPLPSNASGASSARATLGAGLHRRVTEALAHAGEAEVVCIIRPLNNPSARSRIVVINRASARFVADLTNEIGNQPQPTMARYSFAQGDASNVAARRARESTQLTDSPFVASSRRSASPRQPRVPTTRPRTVVAPIRAASAATLDKSAAPRRYRRTSSLR